MRVLSSGGDPRDAADRAHQPLADPDVADRLGIGRHAAVATHGSGACVVGGEHEPRAARADPLAQLDDVARGGREAVGGVVHALAAVAVPVYAVALPDAAAAAHDAQLRRAGATAGAVDPVADAGEP